MIFVKTQRKRNYMKKSNLFNISIIITVVIGMTMFSSCKANDNNYDISEAQRTELEEFLSIFTGQPVLSDYPKGGDTALLYFTLYHLVDVGDDRVRYDERKNEYNVPKLAVDEKTEQYFGVEVDFSQNTDPTIRFKNGEYNIDKYFQMRGGYAKIESVTKSGDDLFLTCYTTDNSGNRNEVPTEPIDGGPILYNFTALVAPHKYNGEKTWKLVELLQIE